MIDYLSCLVATTGEAAFRDTGHDNALVATLRSLGVADDTPGIGERFPDFALPDAWGRLRRLDRMLAAGPLVLSFNRGGWCQCCVQSLRQWGHHQHDLRDAGARLAVITPEIGGRASMLEGLVGHDAEMLCDVDLGVALSAGLAFYMGAPMQAFYREAGLDLGEIYGSASGFLPLAATYVLDQEGIVRFAHVDPDFRIRAEPADVLPVVRALERRH